MFLAKQSCCHLPSLNKVESLVTQDDLELDTIDSQEIVYDDNSSDNSDCQVNTNYSIKSISSHGLFVDMKQQILLTKLFQMFFSGSCSTSRSGGRTLKWEVR